MSITIVGNRKAVISLLKGPGIQKDILRRAERVAKAANSGHNVTHEVMSEMTRYRFRAVVVTSSWRAKYWQHRDHNLTRAIDASRGD